MSNIKVKRSKEHWWKVIERGQPKCSEKKPVPVPLCPLHINCHINPTPPWQPLPARDMAWTWTLSYYGRNTRFTALKVPRQGPLVLLIKVGRKRGKAFGNEEGSVLGSGLLGIFSKERSWAFGLSFVLGWKHCRKISINKIYLHCTQTASLYRTGKCM